MAKAHGKRRLRKGAQSAYIVEEHPIIAGKAKIIRTAASGPYYSLSCYIPSAARNYRKSLRVKNLSEAMEAGVDEYVQLRQRLDRGENIFSKTAGELAEAFLESESKRVTPDGRHSDGITQARFETIKITINKHFLSLVGADTKLDKVLPSKFGEYFQFRRTRNPGVRKSTLRNERSILTALAKFGVKAGLLPAGYVPDFPRLFSNTQKYHAKEDARDAFNIDEWKLVYDHIMHWNHGITDVTEIHDRNMVRDFILISVYTGLRFGEMRKLKWSMVEVDRKAKGDWQTVKISVPEDTKTGKRPVQAAGGWVFERIRTYSGHTLATDWVFSNRGPKLEQFSRRKLYDLWHEMMEQTGLDKSQKRLTFYSLRHTYCTNQLMQEKVNVFLLARNMGTSVKFIEEHYAHVDIDKMKDQLTRATEIDGVRTRREEAEAALDAFIAGTANVPIDVSGEALPNSMLVFPIMQSPKKTRKPRKIRK